MQKKLIKEHEEWLQDKIPEGPTVFLEGFKMRGKPWVSLGRYTESHWDREKEAIIAAAKKKNPAVIMIRAYRAGEKGSEGFVKTPAQAKLREFRLMAGPMDGGGVIGKAATPSKLIRIRMNADEEAVYRWDEHRQCYVFDGLQKTIPGLAGNAQ